MVGGSNMETVGIGEKIAVETTVNNKVDAVGGRNMETVGIGKNLRLIQILQSGRS